jgi:hypothetical protein
VTPIFGGASESMEEQRIGALASGQKPLFVRPLITPLLRHFSPLTL